jgi:universal stress protein F
MKKILVGIDCSPHSMQVLAAAVHLAQLTGARLHLFRGVGIPRGVPAIAWSVAPGELDVLLEREALAELDQAARAVPDGMLAGTSVALGTPWQAVCEAAKAQNVDLIVIGSHGFGAVDRVIGTTAAKVVNHADRSVLVVRASERL